MVSLTLEKKKYHAMITLSRVSFLPFLEYLAS